MCFYRNTIRPRIVINAIKRRPIVYIARTFYRTPFAFVFRRNLIPVLGEVGSHIARGSDVTDKESVITATRITWIAAIFNLTDDRKVVCVEADRGAIGFNNEMLKRGSALGVNTLELRPFIGRSRGHRDLGIFVIGRRVSIVLTFRR